MDISDPDGFHVMTLIKKLELEYGHLIRFRMVSTVPSCVGGCQEEVRLLTMIKAMELQGKRHAMRFLRHLHINDAFTKDASNDADLWEIARSYAGYGLDIDELAADMQSDQLLSALAVDHQILKDWEIESLPAMTFVTRDEALKIEGVYPYDVYQAVMSELLGYVPNRQTGWNVEKVLRHYDASTITELAFILELDKPIIERELKKLSLQQRCRPVPGCSGQAWATQK
ncbi:dithiol-disulfide isomerase [Exiguobacterium sp. SH3S2]|nr:dithiol-disulfide isomerase [Exiguobacterium sp. SH5S4]TCI49365.1 dithiol-disulfide isomerase [Exiguobacterium sp. SH3S3]TCI58148.1 dithiol-disulfide isomerase [Exiguobacterium sp. SH5S13]TCI64678.1 dithiol-disulfide isomerase [Exiguobacterium sp. SH3S2]TCI66498.1 dithiol-disulfide isomerase [Exiguobacterium sp. SH3S1]